MAELSLFLAAFFAATILPFSSEAALATALYNGMPTTNALLSASFGNVLAVIVNYYLGYFLYLKTKKKLLRSHMGEKLFRFGHRYGYWSLLASFLPVIGDPLTIIAGLLRLNFFIFFLLVASLRIARYYFVFFWVQY